MFWNFLLLTSVAELLLVLFEALFSRRPRYFSRSIDIDAPTEKVWEIVNSRSQKFGRVFPVYFDRKEIEGQPNTFLVRCGYRWRLCEMKVGVRELERRDGEALLYELVPEHTDSDFIFGQNHYMAIEVASNEAGTRLTGIHRLEIARSSARVLLPFSLHRMLKAVKVLAERSS